MGESSPHTCARRSLAVVLSYLLMLPAAGPLSGQGPQASSIEIAVETGAERINTNDDLASWEIAVHVQDKDGKRIKGAVVFFQIAPGAGTIAGATTLTLITDDNGRAVAHGFKRGRAGRFDIAISASYQGLSATTVVHQVNQFPFFTPAKIAVIGGVAVAAGLGLWLGTRSTTTTPTTITLGSGSVGPARAPGAAGQQH